VGEVVGSNGGVRILIITAVSLVISNALKLGPSAATTRVFDTLPHVLRESHDQRRRKSMVYCGKFGNNSMAYLDHSTSVCLTTARRLRAWRAALVTEKKNSLIPLLRYKTKVCIVDFWLPPRLFPLVLYTLLPYTSHMGFIIQFRRNSSPLEHVKQQYRRQVRFSRPFPRERPGWGWQRRNYSA
jgi:hypothetical protein